MKTNVLVTLVYIIWDGMIYAAFAHHFQLYNPLNWEFGYALAFILITIVLGLLWWEAINQKDNELL